MRVFKANYKDRTGKQRESARWYVDFSDHNGVRRRLPGFTDKQATEALGRQLEKLAVCRMNNEQPGRELAAWLESCPVKLRGKLAEIGLLSRERAAGGKSLSEHLDDFRACLLARGNTNKHANMILRHCERVFDGAGFATWTDISASKVLQVLAGLRSEQGKRGGADKPKLSAMSFNHYLRGLKSFCGWMVADGRASENPLAHLKTKNARTEARHQRRALEVDEIRRLLEVTQAEPARFDMTGPERAMLYRVAVETGLRANELRTLTALSFDLEGLTVSVEAAYSKHRREDSIPLRSDTAEALRATLAGMKPTAQAFKVPNKPAKMLRADLEAAGIAYRDESDRVVDFHSLRHTTGSLLAAAGVNPKVCQTIMRHSDINLTMSRYSHVYRRQESEAVGKLPDLGQPSQEAQTARATGTGGENCFAILIE